MPGRSGVRTVGEVERGDGLEMLVADPDVEILLRRARFPVARSVQAHRSHMPQVAVDRESHGMASARDARFACHGSVVVRELASLALAGFDGLLLCAALVGQEILVFLREPIQWDGNRLAVSLLQPDLPILNAQ